MKDTILFDQYEAITSTTDENISSLVNLDQDLLPTIFQGFKYPISSWPVIINDELSEKLAEISTLLPQLIQQIPTLYFKDNAKAIADFYFDGNKSLTHFALLCHQKNIEISCRLDLTLTENGFKVLEVNAGSSIGGMEYQDFEHLIRELHPKLDSPTGLRSFSSKQTRSLYIQFLIDKISEYFPEQEEKVNIFIVHSDQGASEAVNVLKRFFDEAISLELGKRKREGEIYIDQSSALQFKNKKLYYGETIIHSVLILDFALNGFQDISKEVLRACILDQVYFPDHLGAAILRDKRNLALLRTLALENTFTPEQNQLILDYIPWTEIFTDKTVRFRGKTYEMIKLLREYKDQFVLKIADGLQGKNVHIGKFISTAEWEVILQETLAHGRYIAQEYSGSIALKAPNAEGHWVPHNLVWGAFGFGKTYGGAWVRMSACENNAGVINSATGAVEAMVYEYHTPVMEES